MHYILYFLFCALVLYIVYTLLSLLTPIQSFLDLAIFCGVVLALAVLIGRAFKNE